MARLQPHRCRWVRWKPVRSRFEPKRSRKLKPEQALMCWQRGARVQQRECLACLAALDISIRSSLYSECKGPQFRAK